MGTHVPRTPEMKLSLLALLACLALVRAGNDNAIERLLDDLFEDAEYDKFAIPMEHGPTKDNGDNALNVAVGLGPRTMELDAVGNLKMNAWLRSSWKDFRLMWEPDQYDGVDRLLVPGDMIWRPDLSIYNQIEYGQGSGEGTIFNNPYQVVINNEGLIYWIPAIKLLADCSDKGFVPLGPGNSAEAQSCHIKLGSWVHDARHINLTAFAGTDQLTMEDMSRNSPWVLESQEQGAIKFTSYDCCPEPYMVAHYRFKVKRAFSINNGEKVFDVEPEDIDKNAKTYGK